MAVKELIETLKTCDENANVVIEQWDGDTFGIGEVNGYAQIKAEDKIWEGLGFVLQWAKYGLKR
ncbi:MAG: hypothetical protein [Bacteriophage sp.]|nr:MAG: hypothetical protein [Bacteriophage sp.]